MKINEIIEHYGNRLKAAAEIGVSITTIDNWVNNDKVPRLSQLAIQTLTKNKLKAD
jgi:transposase